MPERVFKFKYFQVKHEQSVHKLGTDSMLLGSLVDKNLAPKNVLDIGTGSGVLALMMAQKFPEADVLGVEIDASTAKEAKFNAENSPFSKHVQILNNDIALIPHQEPFDLIISNPPFFIGNSLSQDDDKNRVRHQELLPANVLLKIIDDRLSELGTAWLVYPTYEMDLLLEQLPETNLRLHTEYAQVGVKDKVIRKIVRLDRSAKEVVRQTICVRTKDGYTDFYKDITKEYHGMPLK